MAAGFQIIESRFDGSGAFGLDEFGSFPFGGGEWPVDQLPIMQLGSDDLRESRREFVSEVAHERFGHTIAARVWTRARRWTVNFNAVSAETVEVLRIYFRVRLFYLLPDTADPSNRFEVRWSQTEFAPRYVAPGLYSLTFDLEEVL